MKSRPGGLSNGKIIVVSATNMRGFLKMALASQHCLRFNDQDPLCPSSALDSQGVDAGVSSVKDIISNCFHFLEHCVGTDTLSSVLL